MKELLTNKKNPLHYLVVIPMRVLEMGKALAMTANYLLNKVNGKEATL